MLSKPLGTGALAAALKKGLIDDAGDAYRLLEERLAALETRFGMRAS